MQTANSELETTISDSLEPWRGKFIVFDGVDGAGKGVQLALMRQAFSDGDVEVVEGKDPGGTEIGDRIRHVLFDYDLSEMDVRCETLLFMASRAQLMRDVIEPGLKAGRTCLCDRFVSATCAYQGAAGFDPQRVIELARFAVGRTWPDLTIVLDLAPEEGFQRTGRTPRVIRQKRDVHGQVRLFHDTHVDAMEARPLVFHRRVRELFLELPSYYPGSVVIVDGRGSVDEVHGRVRKAMADAIC